MTVELLVFFSFYEYGDHRDLHVLTHSVPTRRSSDLIWQRWILAALIQRLAAGASGQTAQAQLRRQRRAHPASADEAVLQAGMFVVQRGHRTHLGFDRVAFRADRAPRLGKLGRAPCRVRGWRN